MGRRPSAAETGLVYMRDASWFSTPNRYGKSSKYHWPDERGAPVCNTSSAVLDDWSALTDTPGSGVPPKSVPKILRCGRAACAKRWAAFDKDKRHAD